MIYENVGGVHAENILELRAWKAARALEVCQVNYQWAEPPASCS